MSKKCCRDTQNRVLGTGETQRTDGRYCLKHNDITGRWFIYSWQLVTTDRTPKGEKTIHL